MTYVLLISLCTLGLLLAEAKGSQLGKWLTKPLASAAFVALAFSRGALGSGYGTIVFAGLILAALGDVLLIPKALLSFRLGILAFLLGHLAFLVAFVLRGISMLHASAVLLVCAAIAVLVLRWLWPHAGELKGAVVAYIAIISVMVPAAMGTSVQHGNVLIALGAIAFYVSDLSVARDRFVHESFTNRLWGLPLYYGAQVLLAWSTGA
jgi:uncharacterized membrane protein YhhN